MHLPNNVKLYRDDLRALLADGEEPFVMARIASAYGSERVERTPEERLDNAMRAAPRVVRDQAKGQLRRAERQDAKDHPFFNFFVNLMFLDFDIPWPWRNVDWKKVFGGVTVAGRRGSYADRLITPVETTQSLFCVVTDRRLLLVKNHLVKSQGGSLTHVFDMPRQDIVAARRKSRGLSRSRVALEFADSSSITLHAGFINAGGPANRLVRALTGGN